MTNYLKVLCSLTLNRLLMNENKVQNLSVSNEELHETNASSILSLVDELG